MESRPWHKFHSSKMLSLMQEHPNDIIGMWFRLWCVMSNSKIRWVKTGGLDVFSRIIAENETTTRTFMNYMIDHFVDMDVTIKVNQQRQTIYTVVDKMHQELEESFDLKRMKSTRFKKSDLTLNRKKMMQDIFDAYHPSRIHLQRTRFKRVFLRVMRESSKTCVITEDKIVAETRLLQRILEYIEKIKKQDTWENPKFIPGLATFIENEGWKYEKHNSGYVDIASSDNTNNLYCSNTELNKKIEEFA